MFYPVDTCLSTLKAETQTSDQAAATQTLRHKLQELEGREVAEALKRERLVCERDGATNRARILENEVGDARRRIGERDEKSAFCSLFVHWSVLMVFCQ